MQDIPRRSFLTAVAAAGFATAAAGAEGPEENPETSLAGRLAAYAAGVRFEDIDAATLEAVRILTVDALGCAIAAYDEPPVRGCREIALAAGGPATIVGAGTGTTPDLAAFANAAAIRYYDLNDVYVAREASHPSDAIAACFATAELMKSPATELMTAIVVAYEIECRLVDALDLSGRRFDTTVFTLPAVALATGRLMKLDRARLTHAVNIAVNDHVPLAQTRTQTLSDWKGIADANAVRNGVFAAMLAQRGLSGPAPVYEGRSGFFRSVTPPAAIDTAAFGGSGRPFRVTDSGLKAYPAQVYTQTAIVCAQAVAKAVGDLDQVAAIEVATTSRGYVMSASEPEKWAPRTRDTADHSLPYIVARTMFDGDITNDSYAPHKLADPAILAFMNKIAVKEDKAFATPKGNAPPTRITATLSDGRRVVHQVDDMPGFPGHPMDRAGAERKFRGNVGTRLPGARVRSALDALWSLERADDAGAILRQLTIVS